LESGLIAARKSRFDLDQFLLSPQPATITGHAAIRTDDPMTGHDQRDLVGTVCGATARTASGLPIALATSA
jgi:hypothetical protein